MSEVALPCPCLIMIPKAKLPLYCPPYDGPSVYAWSESSFLCLYGEIPMLPISSGGPELLGFSVVLEEMKNWDTNGGGKSRRLGEGTAGRKRRRKLLFGRALSLTQIVCDRSQPHTDLPSNTRRVRKHNFSLWLLPDSCGGSFWAVAGNVSLLCKG